MKETPAPAGYSGTPLDKKLGLKDGITAIALNAPEGVLPAPFADRSRMPARADLIVSFVTERAKLARQIDGLRRAVHPDGAAWIAWPKRASRVATDVDENVIRDVALPTGLVDVKVCAIDETWSGLKLMVRKELR